MIPVPPGRPRDTGAVSTDRDHTVISYGGGVIGDDELRLCGDLGAGHRAIELGISDQRNALAFAAAGAKAIAIDPDPARIETLRADATALELRVECHVGELADLGFATSGSVEAVVADHTLTGIDDLPRLLRQVHRVLRPGRPLVIVVEHPIVELLARDDHAYGSGSRTFGDWFTALSRANFRVDAVHELGVDARHRSPTTLVLRARKEGS